ncbi:MAG: divergent polysaccharide deacetylase family protein, partial [Deltaproteobacteria bacterium]|nr:divergent polysaccharide deacetylase family protein [Deltaproteobacteria bacterium]
LKLYLKAVEPVAETAKLPRVVFIIDDIGYDIAIAEGFMGLKIPVCLSVLPDAPHSKEIARDIAKSNKEMLLHLPMEPEGYPEVNPGNNALMLSMKREAIQKTVRESIEKLPGVKGVNHHMGSRFSQDYVKMKHVLDEIKKHNLYYIDSRTTNLTVAFKVAKALGVPAAEKSLFIDNDLDEKTLTYQMERLLGIARSRGEAIGIGHPHPETLDILKKYTVQLIKDYEVVPASELVN